MPDWAHGSEESVIYALRYYWRASRGHRLRPWRSPYLRWRMETFFGIHAERLTRSEFFRLLWRERRRLRALLQWAAEMEGEYMCHRENRSFDIPQGGIHR